tara:strand:+ start:6454 stop:7056 length:603 start_codon:yes stop_codon:yes gene_type:complete
VYVKYAESKGIKSELLHSSDGHVVGVFKGKGAGKAFQNEPGKHCCQRVPPTENKGRRHTSFVSVAVLPLPDKNVAPLNKADIRIDTMRGSGPGGQHRNMTDSAVRMVHKPTKITVLIDGREQGKNKVEALRILTAKVQQREADKKRSQHDANRRQQMGGGSRGDKVRTYNFIDSRVVDHRTGRKTGNIKAVMKGRLSLIN